MINSFLNGFSVITEFCVFLASIQIGFLLRRVAISKLAARVN